MINALVFVDRTNRFEVRTNLQRQHMKIVAYHEGEQIQSCLGCPGLLMGIKRGFCQHIRILGLCNKSK